MTQKISKNMMGTLGTFTGGIVPDNSSVDTTIQLLINTINSKEPIITPGTSGQYLRGDKTLGVLSKTLVGLDNVDNTSDLSKPISTLTANALGGKEPSLPTGGTNVHYLRGDKTWVTLGKVAVGLSNVDNTSDLEKPISTAVQLALSNKASLLIATTTANGLLSFSDKVKLNGIATGATANSTDENLRDRSTHAGTQSISTISGLQTALDGKESILSVGLITQYLRGDKTWAVLNKSTVGLNNVDNTSDATKPISLATQTALDGKASTAVVTTTTAGLLTAADKVKLNGIATGATANDTDVSLRDRSTHTGTQSADTIVESTTTKMLTSAERSKLSGVAAGATANAADSALRDRSTHTGTQTIATVTGLQSSLDLKAPLASPAFTGTVTVSGNQVETKSDKGVAGGYAGLGLDGKVPSANLPDNGNYKGNWDASNNTPTIAAGVGTNGDTYTVAVAGTQSVTGTSISFVVGDQLRFTTNGNKWERIPNTQLVSSVAGLTGSIAPSTLKSALTLVKADVGLNNVDNTADINKPVSTAQQSSLDLKAPLASPAFTGTVTGITKAMVGLSNVDNTSDISKPISTATQTALDGKASTAVATTTVNGLLSFSDKVKLNGIATGATANSTDALLRDRSTHTGSQLISTISGLQTALDAKESALVAGTIEQYYRGDKSWQTLDKSSIGLTSVDNTSDVNKPISTATQAALDGKASTASVTTSTNGLMTFGDKVKLNGIATGATANSTDENLRDRSTHTGSQSISTITNLQVVLDSKQAALVSNVSIKTVGGSTLLGSGDVGIIGLAYGGTGSTTSSGARTNLGLGTAAVIDTGSSGNTVPLLSNSQTTWSGNKVLSGIGSGANTRAMIIDVDSGATAAYYLRTAGLDRWRLTKTNTAEAGSNTGSDLAFIRCNDAGTNIGTALSISRATGVVTLGAALPLTSGGTGATTVSAAKVNLSLNNVDNTSDLNKPISTAVQVALDTKASLTAPVFNTSVSAPTLISTSSNGNEGGEVRLAAAPNGSLTGVVTIDVYLDRLRLFESGGTARGYYLDLVTGGTGASKNILDRANHTGSQPISTISNLQSTLTDLTTKLDEARSNFVVVDYFGIGLAWNDDWSSAFSAAAAAAATRGGIVYAPKRYTLITEPYIPEGVTIKGPWTQPDEMLGAARGDYDSRNGTIFIGNTGGLSDGLNVNGSCAWDGLVIIRRGLDLPFADAAAATTGLSQFSGTAFRVAGPGATFKNLLVLGFDKAIYSDGFERTRCVGVRGDCTNGIDIRTAYDIPEIEDCQFWPYTTVHFSWTTNALLRRSGTAFYGESVNDWMRWTRCFSYGYYRGFHGRNVATVTFFLCGADNTSTGGVGDHNDAIGFVIDGTCVEPRWIACQTAAQRIGYYYANATAQHGTMAYCEAWACSEAGLAHVSGKLTVTGGVLRSSPAAVGIRNESTDGGFINVQGMHFSALAVGIDNFNSTKIMRVNHCTFDSNVNIQIQNAYMPSLTSAETLIPNGMDMSYLLTGNNGITSISSPQRYTGKILTFICVDGLSFFVSGNIVTRSGANTAVAAGRSFSVVSDGTKWYQI